MISGRLTKWRRDTAQENRPLRLFTKPSVISISTRGWEALYNFRKLSVFCGKTTPVRIATTTVTVTLPIKGTSPTTVGFFHCWFSAGIRFQVSVLLSINLDLTTFFRPPFSSVLPDQKLNFNADWISR